MGPRGEMLSAGGCTAVVVGQTGEELGGGGEGVAVRSEAVQKAQNRMAKGWEWRPVSKVLA